VNAATRKRLDALRPYIGEIERWARRCTAPLFWRDKTGSLRNGSISFVSTDDAVLAVTAGHVADECLNAHSSGTDPKCQIGAAPFEPVPRLLRRHPTLDLAVFQMTEILVATARGAPATTRTWPPSPPEEGSLILLGGFPGAYREERVGEVEFGFVWFAGKVDSSSDRNVGMVLRLERSMPVGQERVPPDTDLGGWSGGPVFRVVETGIGYLELVGVIYEYCAGAEIVLAHPLTHVTASGEMATT
jgi:hypothetical protein